MKTDSDNCRTSAILDIIHSLIARGINVVIYEPKVSQQIDLDCQILDKLEEFKKLSDIIVANRISDELDDVKEKVYSRDLFNKD